MGLSRWLRGRVLGDGAESNSPPPDSALLETLLGHDQPPARSLGEYDSASYPAELIELLNRRDEVVRDLLTIDLADPATRVAAIPFLHSLLLRYPHSLVYEALIHACIDAGRYDEAKGAAFAARQRRQECADSEFPEIRAEIEHLRDWEPEDIEDLRLRREAHSQLEISQSERTMNE